MKPRNREINIFNMSLLDIMCGALGTFCFMMLVLFPYYTRAKNQQGGGSTQQLQQQLDDANKQIEKLEKTFPVTVQIRWNEPSDVDVYLWRAANKPQPQPSLEKKLGPWIKGDTSTECIRGPCTEIWQMVDVPRGLETKLYYILFNPNGTTGPIQVGGSYLSSDGLVNLPAVSLTPQNRIVLVGSFVRTDDDKLKFIPAVPVRRQP